MKLLGVYLDQTAKRLLQVFVPAATLTMLIGCDWGWGVSGGTTAVNLVDPNIRNVEVRANIHLQFLPNGDFLDNRLEVGSYPDNSMRLVTGWYHAQSSSNDVGYYEPISHGDIGGCFIRLISEAGTECHYVELQESSTGVYNIQNPELHARLIQVARGSLTNGFQIEILNTTNANLSSLAIDGAGANVIGQILLPGESPSGGGPNEGGGKLVILN